MEKLTVDSIRDSSRSTEEKQKLLVLRYELEQIGWELYDDGLVGYVVIEKEQ